jgi:amidase
VKITRVHESNKSPRFRHALLVAFFALGTATTSLHAERVRLPLHEATIPELQAAMTEGTLTSEKLIQLCLARIAAYDQHGPSLNSLLHINAKALDEARALDAERKAKGPRGPLHGIPIIPKDNYNTFDMPTTGGFKGLAGSIPEYDAFTIRRLREDGAIILAKANLDEFNSGSSGTSGIGGQTKNPYNLRKSPGGSSAGTGAALAAAFGQAGLGTETGSSIRNPSTKNNLVGLAPTLGLVSRHGVVPSSILLDRTGPMARNVTDVAILLHGIGGMDAGDLITTQSLGHFPREGYLPFLKKNALNHTRIGILRENIGTDADGAEGRAVADAAIKALRSAGATLIDPLPVGIDFFTVLKDVNTSSAERREAMAAYLVSRGKGTTVKSLSDIIEGKQALGKLQKGLEKAQAAPPMYANDDYDAFVRNRAAFQKIVLELFERYDLDAIVYPYQTILEYTIDEAAPQLGAVEGAANYDKLGRGTRISTVTGFPGLTVPAGFTASDGMPIGLEFLGKPWSEGPLLGLGYAFEQTTRHRALPASTPPLAEEWIEFTRK